MAAVRLASRAVPLSPAAANTHPSGIHRDTYRSDVTMLWPGLARRFPVLEIRDFRLLLADRMLAPAAAAFSLVGVAFAVLDATGSTADLSYGLAAQILPALAFALPGRAVAARVP